MIVRVRFREDLPAGADVILWTKPAGAGQILYVRPGAPKGAIRLAMSACR